MFVWQDAHSCIHPHNTGWTWQNERETFACFVLPHLRWSSSSRRLWIVVHLYFIISFSLFTTRKYDKLVLVWCILVMWGFTKSVKLPSTVLTFSIDFLYSLNMSEPRVKRIKTCLPLCKTHISSAGSLAKQNFPTVVEESLCGVSTLLMEVSYRLEALVRTLL